MLIYTISELRRKASEIVNQVIEQDDIVLITRFGKPVIVLLPYGNYNTLVERLDDLEDVLALYQRQDDEFVSFDELVAGHKRAQIVKESPDE